MYDFMYTDWLLCQWIGYIRLVGAFEESIARFTYMDYQQNLLHFIVFIEKLLHSFVEARLCYVRYYYI
jgi:hypothetical protein